MGLRWRCEHSAQLVELEWHDGNRSQAQLQLFHQIREWSWRILSLLLAEGGFTMKIMLKLAVLAVAIIVAVASTAMQKPRGELQVTAQKRAEQAAEVVRLLDEREQAGEP